MNDVLYYAAQSMNDDDILITMDSDDTHDPKYIPKVINLINSKSYNFVVLSRFQKYSKEIGYPKYKTFMSISINLILKILFPTKELRDYTSGYRGIKGNLIKKIVNEYGKNVNTSKGFAGVAEIILKLRKYGLKVKEIPLVYRYDLKQGTSKMGVIITMIAYSKLILRIKLGFTRTKS